MNPEEIRELVRCVEVAAMQWGEVVSGGKLRVTVADARKALDGAWKDLNDYLDKVVAEAL